MRRRLFLKIMIGFWVTFFLIFEGLWVLILAYGQSSPCERLYEERVAPAQVGSAVLAIQLGGLPALERMTASLPEADRALLSALPSGALEARSHHAADPEYHTAEAVAPDGTPFQIRRRMPTVALPIGIRHQPFMIPFEVLAGALLGGLLFSIALAWYITRPILSFRKGFARLALGELDVRLKPEMGARRDELADLAQDFDAMAERLQKLVAARDQLLHDVSHELRSPLARLQVAVGLARQNPENLGTTLARVDLEVRRLDAMVGELLTLSRAESGVSQKCGYVDLACLVSTIVGDARFEAEPSGVQVESTLGGGGEAWADGFIVEGSPELLRRALENVVRNALAVSTAGQVVEVTVARDLAAGRFLVRVADEGPGLPVDGLSSMFEPFVRGPKNTGTKGFGLGLAIAKRLVIAHGGRIEARNREAGGLLVTVCLPISAGPISAGPMSAGPMSASGGIEGAVGRPRFSGKIGLCRAG